MRNEIAVHAERGMGLPSAGALLARAVEAGAGVETLERLLTLRERVAAEEARAAFLEALSAFQAECPVVPKTKTATVRSQSGGSYQYSYAPLEAIVAAVAPLLYRHGLSYRFDTSFEQDPPAMTVTCFVQHQRGHTEFSQFRTPIDTGARMNSMQQSASAQTYGKRYAFCNALGILTGDTDDDGHGASVQPPPPPRRQETGAPRAEEPARAPRPDSTTYQSAPQPIVKRPVRLVRQVPGASGSKPVPFPQRTEPASPAPDDDFELPHAAEIAAAIAERDELRDALHEKQFKLLRATPKYADVPEDELQQRSWAVLDATVAMQFTSDRTLRNLTVPELRHLNGRMDEVVERKLGGVA